jgi:signal transduction histidine kinase
MNQLAFLLLHFVLYGIPALVFAKFKAERIYFFYAYFGFLFVFTQLFAVLYSIKLTPNLTITGGNIAYSSLILITMIALFITHDAKIVRNLIIIEIILNVFLYFLYLLLSALLLDPATINIFHIQPGLFSTTIIVNVASLCVFIIEVLLMFFVLERAKKATKNFILLIMISSASFVGILALDGFLFPFLVMLFEPAFGQYIVGGVIGKLIIGAGFLPFLLLFFVLFRKEFREYLTTTISIRDMIVPTRERLMKQLTETKSKLIETEQNYLAAYKEAKLYRDMFTHDIANVIQGIIANLALYDEVGIEVTDRVVESIREYVAKARRLIDSIRNMSRVEEKLAGLGVKDVIAMLTSVVDDVREEYKDRVEIVFEPTLPSVMVRATDFLAEIVGNIISNAIKYNESPVPRVEIRVSVENEGFGSGRVKIEFIDNGIGVPDDRKALIFSEDHPEAKSGKGMGAALALVVKALDMLGGDIHVEDNVPGDFTRGAKFVIRIPRYVE